MARLAPLHALVHTVTVERPTATTGTAGGVSRSWATHLSNVRCRIQPISGAEAVQYGRDGSTRVYRVVMRYQTDITEGDRLDWSSRSKYLDVTEIRDLQEDNHTMVLTAQEVEL